MIPTLRWGYTGIIVSVVIALAAWSAKTLGLLRAWDGFLYDHIIDIKLRWVERSSEVLLIQLSHDEILGASAGRTLLQNLGRMGPARIVFNFLPRHTGPEFFAVAAEMGNVVFGRDAIPSRSDPDIATLEAMPETVGQTPITWGVAQIPAGLHGLFRTQHAYVTLGTNLWPTMELVAANPPPERLAFYRMHPTFSVDFVGAPGRVPNLSLRRALSGDLLPELVRGRVVLIGYGHGENLPGLYTPVSLGGQMMSLMEFQANAIQTLRSGRPPNELSPISLLVGLLVLSLANALIYQRINAVTGLRITVELIMLFGLGAMVTLFGLGIWIPLSVILIAQLTQYVSLLILKTRLASLAIQELRLRSLARLKERLSPETFYFSSEYWDHLVGLVNQTLDIDRMLFLEPAGHGAVLRVTKAFGCAEEDIRAPVLSLRESPFVEAIETKSPIRLFDILKPSDADENQYLCPLIFAGEVLGVWIIAISPSRALAIPQFDTILVEFSHQMAQLLYHKRKTTPRSALGQLLRQWLTSERENETYQVFAGTAKLLERHYDVLEALLTGMSTATAVYDLFGRVLSINNLMIELLTSQNLVPTRTTALEVIRFFTGKDDSQARPWVRHLILEQTPISVPVKLASRPEVQYLFRMYPLTAPKENPEGPEPFRVRGLVCEIIDITPFSSLAVLKGMIAERLGVQLRNDFAAIEMSASLLDTPGVKEAERCLLLETIHNRVTQATQVIADCQKYLEKDMATYGLECAPLDALALFTQTCQQFKTLADEHHVTLDIAQPKLMNYVLASTEDLGKVFNSIFSLLIKDSVENTVLSIRVEAFPQWVTFHFNNVGFGIPDERLQKILASSEPASSEEFKVLRNAVSWAHNWGGALEATSNVGTGYRIALTLRQFM